MLGSPLSISITSQPQGGVRVPQPPSVAPILEVSAEFGSYVAELNWTPSNRTSSPGFQYRIDYQKDGAGYAPLAFTTDTFYQHDFGSSDGTYDFIVTPENDAGEGPASNPATVVLPGEV
jgi:hypothetical protein